MKFLLCLWLSIINAVFVSSFQSRFDIIDYNIFSKSISNKELRLCNSECVKSQPKQSSFALYSSTNIDILNEKIINFKENRQSNDLLQNEEIAFLSSEIQELQRNIAALLADLKSQFEVETSTLQSQSQELQRDKTTLAEDLTDQVQSLEAIKSALSIILQTRVNVLNSAELSWTIPEFNEILDGLADEYKEHDSQDWQIACCGGYKFKLEILGWGLNIGIDINDVTDYTSRAFQLITPGSSIAYEHPSGDETKRIVMGFPNFLIEKAGGGVGLNTLIAIDDLKKDFVFPDGSVKITALIKMSAPSIPRFIV